MEAGGGRCKPFLRWVLFMVGLFCQEREMDESKDSIAGGKLAFY